MPRIGASIVVREHRFGPDLVRVTMLDPEYPTDLLRTQCAALGSLLGSSVRGLEVAVNQVGSNPDQSFVMASFAVDGLMDLQTGRVQLEPLIQAFAGAPEPFSLDSMSINLEGMRPGEGVIRSFYGEHLAIAALATDQPPGLEYRVWLRTQDPRKLKVPVPGAPASTQAESPAPQPISLVHLGLLAGGSILVAALVYFAASRKPRGSAQPDREER
ncbi:MAG: hypothetical protein MH204_08790 [Fimbriimonadaceae bacterium]|nr:hypothetical protein [Fimbriimonadaceae bacterium]